MNNQNNLPPMTKIGIVFLTWRRCLQKRLLPHGISLKQLYVLRRLKKHEVLSPSRIAEMLYCDRPTATYILNTMKRYGWIESRSDPQNRKLRQIRLAPSGMEKLASLANFTLEPAFDPMACFTEPEREQFDALLQKLYHHMKALRGDRITRHGIGDNDE